MLISLSASAFSGGLFRWTDAHGRVHYSDSVPAKAAQGGHDVITQEGYILQEIEPRKTALQLQAERKRAVEKEEVRRAKMAQDLRDTVLLSTFSSVEELDQIRDQRLQTLGARINIAQRNLLQREAKVDRWKLKRDELKIAGKTVPMQLNDNIQRLSDQAIQTRDKIIRLYASREEINERFRKDRARYVELAPSSQRRPYK